MAKKGNHPKPVKQHVSGPANDKHNTGQDKDIAGKDNKAPKGKTPVDGEGKRSQGDKKKSKKAKKEFNAAEAEKLAASGTSVFIPKTDFVHLLISGALILTKFITAIDQKLQVLKVPAYMRAALKRDIGQRAKNGPFHKPMLDPTRLITVYRTGQQITDDDLLRIEAMERAKHDAEQETARLALLATIPDLRALHDAAQLQAKAHHYDTADAATAEGVATRSSATAVPTTVTVARFVAAEFVPPRFQAAAFVPSAASRATLANDDFEFKPLLGGGYMKVPKLNAETLTVCVRDAQLGVAAKVYRSPELEHLNKEYDDHVRRYNDDIRDENTHAKNMADTFSDGLSFASREAMGRVVTGGTKQLDFWRAQSNYLDIINAFFDTHEGQGHWNDMTQEEKESFRRSQEAFLSKDKLAQRL